MKKRELFGIILLIDGLLLLGAAWYGLPFGHGGWKKVEAKVIGSEVMTTGNESSPNIRYLRTEFEIQTGGGPRRETVDSENCYVEACVTENLQMFPPGATVPVYYRVRPETVSGNTMAKAEIRLSPPADSRLFLLFLAAAAIISTCAYFIFRTPSRKRLFHVSEEAGIDLFHPRPPLNPEAGVEGDAVWAVDGAHVCNYLLPRDCPRVTFLGPHGRVVAVEEAWLERIKNCRLFLYEFSPENFTCIDKGAGYFISRRSEKPISVRTIDDALAALKSTGAKLQVIANLHDLRDEVVASGREFSIIRFRNARPPPTASR